MAKLCKCGKPIYGRARKYCPECKRKEHLEQMAKYYRDNQKRWMQGGLYWDQQRHNKFGTGGLGSHKLDDSDKEYEQIQKEFKNLGLRVKKEHWQYKP